jgi:hypothetical protein
MWAPHLFTQTFDHGVLLPQLLHQVLPFTAPGVSSPGRAEGYVKRTHLGAERGFRPSTTHWWPLFLHRLQTVASAGKSHFILSFLQWVHAPGLWHPSAPAIAHRRGRAGTHSRVE